MSTIPIYGLAIKSGAQVRAGIPRGMVLWHFLTNGGLGVARTCKSSLLCCRLWQSLDSRLLAPAARTLLKQEVKPLQLQPTGSLQVHSLSAEARHGELTTTSDSFCVNRTAGFPIARTSCFFKMTLFASLMSQGIYCSKPCFRLHAEDCNWWKLCKLSSLFGPFARPKTLCGPKWHGPRPAPATLLGEMKLWRSQHPFPAVDRIMRHASW